LHLLPIFFQLAIEMLLAVLWGRLESLDACLL
jgi:hypothetical protein